MVVFVKNKNLNCIAADIIKFLKNMEKDCLMTKVKSNPIINKELDGSICMIILFLMKYNI